MSNTESSFDIGSILGLEIHDSCSSLFFFFLALGPTPLG